MKTALRTSVWVAAAVCLAGLAYLIYVQGVVRPPASGPLAASDEQTPAAGFAAGSADAGVLDSTPRQAPEGMREYRDEAHHISLFYPAGLTFKKYDEGKGAATITFQNAATAQGFQIFVVPHNGTQVSKARFVQDIPSGVMESPLNVKVGGVAATSFYSTNQLLGDTAEIWLLRGGLLYEVTAPRAQAAWLSDILNTWRFI